MLIQKENGENLVKKLKLVYTKEHYVAFRHLTF